MCHLAVGSTDDTVQLPTTNVRHPFAPLYQCVAKSLHVLLLSEEDDAEEHNPMEADFSPELDQSVQL